MTTKTKTPAKNVNKTTTKKVVVKSKRAAGGGTFTTCDLAKERGEQSKTLRAKIRRRIKAGQREWEKLMIAVDGKKGLSHTFKDNATTRKQIKALLA